MERSLPNVLVTGTPGTGKTTTAQAIAEICELEHIDVGEIVKSKMLHGEYIEKYDTYELDEDKLLDELEEMLKNGGKIVDFHTCQIFPERWFDLVLVLRTDTEPLYDRMEKRGYNKAKIGENMECEIMQVVLETARDSYDPEIVIELPSNTVGDMESNADRVKQWLEAWKQNNNK
ncbi:AAA domain-containing protein [Parasitella parasitica]|nr:AAA domain-containing protein [Parasitella parasitica]